MPNVMVDTSWPTSEAALALCRFLECDTADVYPVRLWCWGIASDRVSGRFTATADQLADILRFRGDSKKILSGLLMVGIIEKTENENEFRINGWSRNARFFRERARLRKKHSTQKRRGDAAGAPQNARGDAGLSSSSSYSYSEYSKSQEKTLPSNHPEVAFFEARWIEKFKGPKFTKAERSEAAEIIARSTGAGVPWSKVIELYSGPAFAQFGGSLNKLKWQLRDVLRAATGGAPASEDRARAIEEFNRKQLAEAEALGAAFDREVEQ